MGFNLRRILDRTSDWQLNPSSLSRRKLAGWANSSKSQQNQPEDRSKRGFVTTNLKNPTNKNQEKSKNDLSFLR